jgi:molybdate transport system permease protein
MNLTPDEMTALWLSMKVALACTVVIAVPGVACGWLLARRRFPGKLFVDAVVHAPLVMPPVVTGYLLLRLLGQHGAVGQWLHGWFGISLAFSWHGAVIASAVMGFPLMVRSVRLAIDLVDPRLEQAAVSLGARPLRAFLTVTLPLAGPGILTGLVLAFARSLGEFGATITFVGNIAGETRTLPLAVFTYVQTPGGDQAALRLVVISVLLSIGALIVSEILARRMRQRLGEP